MRLRFLTRIAVLGLAAIFTSVGVAAATGTDTKQNNQLKVCVNVKSGAVHAAKNNRCARGERTGFVNAKGARGPAGAQGPAGEPGPAGSAGAQGSQGSQGAKGDKGDTGATGARGAKGDTGDTGAQGAQGEKGDDGAAGLEGVDTLLPGEACLTGGFVLHTLIADVTVC